MAGKIIKNYGTQLKGMPLKNGPQTAGKPKSVGKSPYSNGTSKGKK